LKGNFLKNKKIIAHAANIIRHLAQLGGATQTQLLSLTGLRRTSVFYVMETLFEAGFVEQAESLLSQRGRPSTVWKLRGGTGNFVAAYSGSKSNTYNLYDFAGRLISSKKTAASPDIERVVLDLKQHLSGVGLQSPLCGLALGVSGIIDARIGEILHSDLWGIRNYPLQTKLFSIFKDEAPMILLENNARLAAWGEKTEGVCKGVDDFLTLQLRTGRAGSSGGARFILL